MVNEVTGAGLSEVSYKTEDREKVELYPHCCVQHFDFPNRSTATEQPSHFLLGETRRKRPGEHGAHISKVRADLPVKQSKL